MTTGTRPAHMPADTPDYMADAWVGCIMWAAEQPEVLAAFRRDTGNTYEPPATGLEAAIDDATGHGAAFCKSFIEWVNVNVWGPIDGEEPSNSGQTRTRNRVGKLRRGEPT